MTRRERLIRALRGGEVDRLPWSLCMDAYFTSSLPAQGMGDMDLLQTLRYLHNDIMERHVPTYRTHYRGLARREYEGDGETVLRFETPCGTLTEVFRRSGGTSFRAKHLVTEPEELAAFRYLLEHTAYEEDFAYFLRRDAEIGDDGLATPTAPFTPIQALLQVYLGVENTVYFLADYPEEMSEILGLLHQRNKEAFRIIARCPAPVVFAYEDTSTTVMSRGMYEEHCLGQIDEYAAIAQEAGQVYITHMCGKLKGFADLVGKGRQNGVDSLCPPTTGDFWAHEARACWGEDKVIIGGLEPPALVFMDEEQTVRYTVEVLNRMAPGKAFILSSGDAVAHGTPIGNLLAITRLVERYGAYPLSGAIDPDEAVEFICKEGK